MVRPLVTAEKTVRRASGKDQIIVAERSAVCEFHDLRGRFDASHIGHQDARIAVSPQEHPARRGDISRRQGRCRDLIKQWLKKMVIGTIDEEYIRIRVL